MNKNLSKLLKALGKTREKYRNISPETGQFLNLLVKDRKYKKAFEIGTSNGYSGIWLAEALSRTKGHLYTIESHKERRHLAQKNFKKSGLAKHITSIGGHAPEGIPRAPKKFDLIFFDATKYEQLDYFKALKTRVKKGGTIITDNAISHKKELAPYLKTLKSIPGWQSTELNIGTGLLVSIKK